MNFQALVWNGNLSPFLGQGPIKAGLVLASGVRVNTLMCPFLKITALAAGLTFLSLEAPGQKLSIGVVGGWSLTDDYRGAGTTTVPWITPDFNTTVTTVITTGLHDFVIGPKLELALPAHFSFEVDALHRNRQWKAAYSSSPSLGPSFRAAGNLSGTNPSRYGVTSGAGVEARTRWLTVSPAFRFTRWTADPAGDMSSPHTYTIRNRAELLVGFSF